MKIKFTWTSNLLRLKEVEVTSEDWYSVCSRAEQEAGGEYWIVTYVSKEELHVEIYDDYRE